MQDSKCKTIVFQTLVSLVMLGHFAFMSVLFQASEKNTSKIDIYVFVILHLIYLHL